MLAEHSSTLPGTNCCQVTVIGTGPGVSAKRSENSLGSSDFKVAGGGAENRIDPSSTTVLSPKSTSRLIVWVAVAEPVMGLPPGPPSRSCTMSVAGAAVPGAHGATPDCAPAPDVTAPTRPANTPITRP